MKIKLALFAFLAMFVLSCGDDESGAYTCSSCDDSPEALPANDGSGKGVYKGVVVGSTGNIQFNIANVGSTISASLVLDGKRYPLTTEATYSSGFEGCFYGKKVEANDIQICFYVNNTGGFEVYNVIIPDHPDVWINLIKELSTDLVIGFEGTYSGDSEGTFNMVVRRNVETGNGFWYVLTREGDNDASYFEGELGAEGTILYQGDVSLVGEIAGDVVAGTWISGSGTIDEETGTWKGKRKL